MDFLTFILIFVIAFQAGKYYGYYKLTKIMKEVADEEGFDLEKELGLLKDKEDPKLKVFVVPKLNVEQHGDMLYLFDVDTDKFICQGSSVQELAKLAKELKNVSVAAVKHGDKIFAFKDGESVEVL